MKIQNKNKVKRKKNISHYTLYSSLTAAVIVVVSHFLTYSNKRVSYNEEDNFLNLTAIFTLFKAVDVQLSFAKNILILLLIGNLHLGENALAIVGVRKFSLKLHDKKVFIEETKIY